jgi:hypothetical protein
MTEANKSKLSNLPIYISVVSLVASLGTFAFQYWTAQSQQHINTAVEFSKMYLTDKEVSNRYGMLVFSETPITGLEKTKFLEARSYVDLIEYISYLSNKRFVNDDYIATRIKCDIVYVRETIVGKHPELSDAIEEMDKYVRDHQENIGCPARIRKQ